MYVQEDQNYNQPQVSLPNATAVLILGIISIVSCCCYGGGLILGIITLILANKDMNRYLANPGMFTASSYSNLKAGRVCAIIAVSISVIYIIFMVVVITMFGWATVHDPNAFRAAMENMAN
ncbi:MAG: DUF4190 domain-containing protein [Bacteroidetes bacterium]|nr:DUF4190 domain-containing protein [Bacteroidota bacterium]